MTLKNFLLSYLLSAAVSVSASAGDQNYFLHYDTSDGLLNNSVGSIVEDRLGFVWFGTKNGACRFDGNSFLSVGPQEIVLSLCTDNDGCVWMSTVSALYKVDEYASSVEKVEIKTMDRYRPSFSMICDRNSFVWTVSNGCLTRLDARTYECRSYPVEDYFYAERMCLDMRGRACFTSSDGCLMVYDEDKDGFDRRQVLSEDELRSGMSLQYLTCVGEDMFVMSTTGNDIVKFFVGSGRKKTLFRMNQDADDAQVRCLLGGDAGGCYVGTDKGLYVFDGNGDHKLYKNNPLDKYSLSNDNIRYIARDSLGRLWLGTYYSGVNLSESSVFDFYRDLSDRSDMSIKGSTVRAIMEDKYGSVWMGTEDGYLNIMDPDGASYRSDRDSRIPMSNFHSIVENEDKVYVASYDNGVFVFDGRTRKLVSRKKISSGNPVTLMKTAQGQIWLGASGGLYHLDDESSEFEMIPGTDTLFVHAISQLNSFSLLLGTYSRGVLKYDMTTNELSRARTNLYEDQEPQYVTSMFRDKDGCIWCATEGKGLFRYLYDAQNEKFDVVHYTADDGLPSDIVAAITQSRDGRIWVSTDRGVVSVNQNGKASVVLDKESPIGNSFRYGAVCHTHDDRIFMGSTLGALSFHPSDYAVGEGQILYMTDVLAGSQSGETSVFAHGESAFSTKEVSVKYKNASYLKFKFAVPHSDQYKKIRYRYALSRRKDIIRSVTEDDYVTIAGLSPGKYRFTVSIDDTDSADSSKSVTVRIVPPFLMSSFAKCLYVFLILTIVSVFIIQSRKKRDADRQLLLKTLEDEKQKETYDAKIDFFTNIAHDIRTPLSLIKMPVDKIVSKNIAPSEFGDDVKIIKANTDRLLDLTNQLLDFRKMEDKQLKLSFVKEDICSIVNRCCEYFERAALSNGIKFDRIVPDRKIMIMCASASVEKIISNLLSNAFKYCESSVRLELALQGETVVLKVNSDGTRILPENRDKIFEPFFQEKNRKIQVTSSKGSGLGLPLSRSLARLHNGDLVLGDFQEEGNTFILSLPVSQKEQILLDGSARNDVPDEDVPFDDESGERHVILLVEDNRELAAYLKKELSEEYNVLVADNGAAALDKLSQTNVDLVVSDIMMPEMDGCELCNRIKSDLDYSHIPVILLTAGVGMESHLESLRVGADGYLEKPFSIELLKANITNIFKNKELSYKLFASSPLSCFKGLKSNGSIDDEFMKKFNSEILERMSDSDFCVDDLTSSLGMSRSSLFRKVKANIGLSINEYIRLVRLKKAAELLSEKKYRISEVAYLVGFTSPSYFANKFQEQFKVSPSEFLKQLK